jgi:hypothetical protein
MSKARTGIFSSAGSSLLAWFGETTILFLQVGSVLMGAGMASIFATGTLTL